MAKLTPAQIQALLAQLADEGEDEALDPVDTDIRGTHFASLGFVAVGVGADPGEGATISVPTKAGKLAKVQTMQAIDCSPFSGSFGDWAYTYKRLKRGE